MFWNTLMGRAVIRLDETIPRDASTGIMLGAEPITVGPETTGRAMLMVHGFIGSPNNFNDLPEQVAEAGWHVRVMLLPGHGTSPVEFETTTAAQLERAVENELTALQERFATVVLLGHSMGGALATLVASRRRVDGLILVSPYYAVTHRWYYLLHPEAWASLLSPAVRWMYRPADMQPVNRIEAREKIVSYTWIPVKGALTAMELAARARSDAVTADIVAPTLLLHSKIDSVTDPEVAEEIFRKFPATDKEVVWLRRSDHIVFWDYDREEVIRQVVLFLRRITPTAQESASSPGE